MNTIYDRDDIDILYSLLPYGWSTCILYIGDLTDVLHISHVFGDPIGDLIEANILLLKGASEVEFTWWGEPGGNLCQINCGFVRFSSTR